MGTGKSPAAVRRIPDITHDAVLVVPGIMGSELVDTATGDVLWGLHLRPYLDAWRSGGSLRRLRLTDEERKGNYGRVEASQLLRVPVWLPVLRGFEPYGRLVERLRTAVADPAAVREFPYDWRLPVAYNAGELAKVADAHLTWWREQPAHQEARRHHPTGREAKLVLVAHSMGGLLVRELMRDSALAEKVRACVTLGTPFHGAVKAALLLSTGEGVPLPARRPLRHLFTPDADHGVRALARTLPGIYDLLPTYRCLVEDGAARRLEIADLVGLDADRDLAAASLWARGGTRDLPLAGHELVLGRAQATAQSLTVRGGVAHPLEYELRDDPAGVREVDRMGDGTVPVSAAELRGRRPWRLAQQHGALARADDAISFTLDVVREVEPELLGPPLAGETGIGLWVPETAVPVGVAWPAVVTGLAHPRQGTCTVTDVATGGVVGRPPIEVRDQLMQAPVELQAPGLHRITVAGSGATPTSQLVLAVPDDRR